VPGTQGTGDGVGGVAPPPTTYRDRSQNSARVHIHAPASWRIAEPQARIDADMLIGDVADEIGRLNDQPDSMR